MAKKLSSPKKIHKIAKKNDRKDWILVNKKKYVYQGESWNLDQLKKRKKLLKEGGYSVRTVKSHHTGIKGRRIVWIYARKIKRKKKK